MDPQATLNDMLDAVAERDWDRAEELSDALYDWLQKQGMPPPKVRWEKLAAGWRRHVATLLCHLAKTEAHVARVSRRQSRRKAN